MPKPSSAPPEVRYPHLFSPISLGPIELPHRVIIPGHSMVHGDSSGLITDPDWVAKVRRGEEKRIRPCMSCNQFCLGAASLALPAGLECARVAAQRGRAVTLYEASGELGGAMRLAARSPYREEMLPPLAWWERELRLLGVTIRLHTGINDPGALEADEIVWATGGSGRRASRSTAAHLSGRSRPIRPLPLRGISLGPTTPWCFPWAPSPIRYPTE